MALRLLGDNTLRLLQDRAVSGFGKFAGKAKDLMTDIDAGVSDLPAQVGDLLQLPSAVLGLPRPGFQSKLATETVPYLLQKATEPVGTFNVPPLSAGNIKSLFTGKGISETNEISPTPVDIGLIASLVGGAGGSQVARNVRFNKALEKTLAAPMAEAQLLQAQRRAGVRPWPAGKEPIETTAEILPEEASIFTGRAALPQPVRKPSLQPMAGGQVFTGQSMLKPEETIKGLQVIQTTKPSIMKDITGRQMKFGPNDTIFTYPIVNAKTGQFTGKIMVKDGDKGIVSSGQFQNLQAQNKPISLETEGIEEVVKGQGGQVDIDKRANEIADIWLSEGQNDTPFLRQRARNEASGEIEGEGETKFSQYQLPGGENYREVLIKAPVKGDAITYEDFVGQGLGKTTSDYAKYLRENKEGVYAQDFKSSHWDEPNVLAHVRMNDRTTPDGKKVLFIEELQSDWAREAREPQNLDDIKHGNATPQHPLLKNWQELALKRAIKEAVAKGYDYISWTTGEQQAERYDLSKQIDYINYVKNPEGTYSIAAFKDDYPKIQRKNVKESELEGFIGKDIAHKIINGEGTPRSSTSPVKTLEGENLKIGGEWAKNLYDRQIPNILKDLTRGEVRNINIEWYNAGGDIRKRTQPALKVTPELRIRISGQPIGGGQPTKIGDIISGQVPPTEPPPTAMSGAPEEEPEKPMINLDRLNISDVGKQKIIDVSKQVKPELEKLKGEPLTHSEVIDAAMSSDILTRGISREKTKQMEAAILRTRQNLSAMAEEKGISLEFVDNLKIIKSIATDAGRTLNSLAIGADPNLATMKEKLVNRLLELGVDMDKIIQEAAGVDFTNPQQVTEFYRKFDKAKAWDVINEYRYINLLSSPKTHIINAFSNLMQVAGLSPATKLMSGLVDPIYARLKPGYERMHYATETPAYIKGALSSIGEAGSKAWEALMGRTFVERPDVAHIPTGTKLLKPFRYIPQALEAADVYFRTIAYYGELEAQLSKGMSQVDAERVAKQKASYWVFRAALDPANQTGQGHLLSAIDNLTTHIYALRKIPIIGRGVSWFIPFVQTPMNIGKQMLEFSPTGLTSIPGAKDKVEQISKTLIGSLVAAIAGFVIMKQDSTWEVPTNPKEKELFFAAGRKPFSIKFGNTWVSYSRLNSLSLPIAMAAATKFYLQQNPKSASDSNLQKASRVLGSMSEFFASQSYLESIGDLMRTIKGEQGAFARLVTGVPGQLIPVAALQRWINNYFIDPVFRKAEKGLSPEAIVDNMRRSIIGGTLGMEPYKFRGQVSRRDLPLLNAFSPFEVGVSKQFPETQLKFYQQQRKIQEGVKARREKFSKFTGQPMVTEDEPAELLPLLR